MDICKIRYERLITAFILTFILADIYPHPNLSPGLMQSTFNYFQPTILSK
ncbi:MAG: hypothetical protein QNJ41_22330 [Xenococcaceae cyanobacterium MO_188.B32]|nr:hypothetical protein [Xenococcaceae cyanobacterium MO_188.B32]